jgi:gluconokinase
MRPESDIGLMQAGPAPAALRYHDCVCGDSGACKKMKNFQGANPPARWVVMGVSGCGKSAVGARLAAALGIDFIEGDADHPPASIAKMAAGIPLTDEDRHGWLLLLQARIRQARARGAGMVLSCSALKRRYRDLLREGDPDLMFIHLGGSRELIEKRMQGRTGHFMPVALLDSQFRDLEPLAPEERGLLLDIRFPPEELVRQVLQHVGLAAPD